MTNHDVDVLVVGAGPTGLTLACELARHGLTFRIIDENAVGSDKSKALAVHSRTLEVFEDMGIVDRFLEYGLKLRGVNAFAGNKQIAHLSLDELDSPFSFTLSIPQSDTERLLMERLSELGFAVERSTKLISLLQEKEGVVCTIKTASGSEQNVRSRWVVGTDGAHSTVRKALNLEFSGSKYPDLVYLSDAKVEGLPRNDEIYVFNPPTGLTAFFPYGGGRYRVVATMGEGKDDKVEDVKQLPEPSLEEMQRVANERCHFNVALSDQLWSASLYLHRRHVNRYRVGYCFLGGDAAHIHSPAGGQGMNTGIQDSYNLAWKLGLVKRNVASDSLLESYHDERLGIALGVLKMTDMFMKINTLKSPVARHIRNKLAPVLVAQEVIQDRIKNGVAELSLGYRNSPIVEEHSSSMVKSVRRQKDMPTLQDCFEFHRGPEAGDRAPDAFLMKGEEDSIRLFELTKGTRHTLVLFSGDETSDDEIETFKSIATTIKKSHADLIKVVIVVDSQKSAVRCSGKIDTTGDDIELHTDFEMSCHHKYNAGSSCLYLIRPDGYIGFRSQPIDMKLLYAYLNKIFDRMPVVASK